MKYSIVQGIVTHPRIGEDLKNKNLTFYDLGESDNVVDLIQNLMTDVLNPSKDSNKSAFIMISLISSMSLSTILIGSPNFLKDAPLSNVALI